MIIIPKISEENRKAKIEFITNTALKIFSEKGFSLTTMDDIVSACKMSKGGIYNYFKSKEEIFLAIAEERFNKRHELITTFPDDITSTEKLTRYLKWILEGLFDEETSMNARFTFEFWSVMSRHHTIPEIASRRYKLFYNDLADILKEGISVGEFQSNIDIDAMVYIILSTTDGIGYSNSVMGLPITKAVVENYIDMILEKIVKK